MYYGGRIELKSRRVVIVRVSVMCSSKALNWKRRLRAARARPTHAGARRYVTRLLAAPEYADHLVHVSDVDELLDPASAPRVARALLAPAGRRGSGCLAPRLRFF